MHVLPAKHSYAWLPKVWLPKCDYRTDRHTHRQTPDKVIPMCSYASQATQKFKWPRCKFTLEPVCEKGENKMGATFSLYTVFQPTNLGKFFKPAPVTSKPRVSKSKLNMKNSKRKLCWREGIPLAPCRYSAMTFFCLVSCWRKFCIPSLRMISTRSTKVTLMLEGSFRLNWWPRVIRWCAMYIQSLWKIAVTAYCVINLRHH